MQKRLYRGEAISISTTTLAANERSSGTRKLRSVSSFSSKARDKSVAATAINIITKTRGQLEYCILPLITNIAGTPVLPRKRIGNPSICNPARAGIERSLAKILITGPMHATIERIINIIEATKTKVPGGKSAARLPFFISCTRLSNSFTLNVTLITLVKLKPSAAESFANKAGY